MNCFRISANVRRYVQLPTAWRWHGFLPSYWMWRFFRFMKSSRNAKTMTPGGSDPAFSRGQLASYYGMLFLSITEGWPQAIAYTDLLGAAQFIYAPYISYNLLKYNPLVSC